MAIWLRRSSGLRADTRGKTVDVPALAMTT